MPVLVPAPTYLVLECQRLQVELAGERSLVMVRALHDRPAPTAAHTGPSDTMPRPTRSLWYDTALVSSRPALAKSVTADVCVVSAGIAGLSVAYTLARAGRRVLVLDRDQIGGGESGRTTAHLSNAIDDRYVTLEKA